MDSKNNQNNGKNILDSKENTLSVCFVSWDSVPPGSCSSGITYNNNFTGHVFRIENWKMVTYLFGIEQPIYYKTV